jgi:hypothetical protein
MMIPSMLCGMSLISFLTRISCQWICWDFHIMHVRLTQYTIKGLRLKSWVIESSLDGETWTEIDRKAHNNDLKSGWGQVCFPVANSAECRFIRLTQTGQRHSGVDYLHVSNDYLYIRAFEFFGTLLE